MGERRDYVALDWVAGEIEETLQQARQSLEAYSADTADGTKLRFCLTYIHQVQGTLGMVEFFGAALLAKEAEKLVQALVSEQIPESHKIDALSVLRQVFEKLPLYLKKVKSARQEFPSALLPILNDLRAVMGGSLLSETALFVPAIYTDVVSADAPELIMSGDELVDVARKLRQMYQMALLGFIRNRDVRKNLNYLAKVCARLVKLSTGRPIQQLWKISIAALEGLLNQSISPSISVKILLRQLDKQIKNIIENGEAAFNGDAPVMLQKNLLYYVAQSQSNSRFIEEIRSQYKLESSLLGVGDFTEEGELAAPNPDVLENVVEVLASEMKSLAARVEVCGADRAASLAIVERLPEFQRITDSMAMLGLGRELKRFEKLYTELAKCLAVEEYVPTEMIQRISADVDRIAQGLSYQKPPEQDGAVFNDSEEAQEHLDMAFLSVLLESRNGLEQAKEAIIEFVATQWNHQCLEEIPVLLAAISGSLAMVPLTRASAIVESCKDYVLGKLLAEKAVPEWQVLDTLADAITSVDYYLERMIDDASDADCDAILDVAEESIAVLAGVKAVGSGEQAVVMPLVGKTGVTTNEKPSVNASDESQEFQSADVIPLWRSEPAASSSDEGVQEREEELLSTDPSIKSFDLVVDSEAAIAGVSPPVESEQSEVAEETEAEAEAEDELDPEIIEIFIEEAGEVLETIEEIFPEFAKNLGDQEVFATVRRGFHTLKGSGRLVGAGIIAEFAWAIENMLNRIVDGNLELDEQRIDLIEKSRNVMPGLVDAFSNQTDVDEKSVNHLMARAFALTDEQNPDFNDVTNDSVGDEIGDHAGVDSNGDNFTESEEEVGEEADRTLFEVFSSEAETHLLVLDEYIQHAQLLVGPAQISDGLQRALHTLKGSAYMAGVGSVGDVVTAAERMVKELRASQLKADVPAVDLLAKASGLVKLGVEDLASGSVGVISGTAEFTEAVEKYLEAAMQVFSTGEKLSEQEGIPPEALNQFLDQGLDILNRAIDGLTGWRGQLIPADSVEVTIAGALEEYRHLALAINLVSIGDFTEVAKNFIVNAAAALSVPSDECFSFAMEALDALIDMMDQLAGYQDPVLPGELQQRLLAYDFAVSGEGEGLGLVSNLSDADDDGASVDVVPDSSDADDNEDFAALFDIDDGDADTVDLEDVLSNVSEVITDTGMIEALAEDFGIDAAGVDLESNDAVTAGSNDIADLISEQKDIGVNAEAESEIVGTDSRAEEELVDDAVVDSSATDSLSVNEPINEVLQREPDIEEADKTVLVDTQEEVDPGEISIPGNDGLDVPVVASTEKVAALPEDDDDIDAEILEIFLEESDDLLEAMDEAIHKRGDDGDGKEFLDDMQRHLHTFKGGARLTGLVELGNLSHDFESMLISAEAQGVDIDGVFLSEVQKYQDQLIALVDLVKQGDVQDVVHESEAGVLKSEEVHPDGALVAAQSVDDTHADISLSEAELSVTPAVEEEPVVVGEVVDPVMARPDDNPPASPAEIIPDVDEASAQSPVEALIAASVSDNSVMEQRLGRRAPQEMVKVSAQLLENLVNLAGETSISRGRAEEQVSELMFSLDDMQITIDRLQEQVRRLDMETEAQIIFRQEQVESVGLDGFDPLEFDRYSQLQQLSRSLLESSSDLIDIKSTLADKSRDMETLLVQQSRINTELQEGLMRSRMVPFSRMVPRLRRIIRQVSTELGKHVDFKLENVEGELDRSVLERIVAPLEHMLRNAVDHGIESEADRVAAGKPHNGTVRLSLAREGGEIIITLSDDGGGVNLDAVRTKAIERGLMDQNSHLTDHEILQFILQSGFSTATKVTQISGRGVGMDVVNSEIKQLGGLVEIDSVLGEGTTFSVRLPFTVSVNRALMVSVAGDIYAIPLNTIEGIVRVSPFELEAYYEPDAPLFEYASQSYVMRYMGALLNLNSRPNLEGLQTPLPVILVRGTDHSVAVQVDSLLGSREIVVKTLGPQFGMVQGLSGATVLGDGSVVVILDLIAMVRADSLRLSADSDGEADAQFLLEEKQSMLVMVVDDSVTVRKVTSRLLERHGIEVVLAKDGVDAVTQLQEMERIPDLMLLDIEMPRMDGFEVASRVKHTSRTKDLPIIMITSRTGEKHRERAMSLGVERYMGKPYQEVELMETINELAGDIYSMTV